MWIGQLLLIVFIISPAFAGNTESEELISRLLSNNKAEVENALSYISEHKPPDILPLLSSGLLSDKDIHEKKILINAFKNYPVSETTEFSLEILDKTNSFILKKEIIEYLSNSEKRMVVPAILKELVNPFFTVRESAILALKKLGDDRMFPFILNMMESPDAIFRIYALEAIYHLYDLRFYDHLIQMLKDDNKSVRYYVLKCIEENKLGSALKYVRNTALNDNSWEVRVKAIQIIENLTDKDSMHVLLVCLKDDNREIRYYSSRALCKLRFKASAKSISYYLYKEPDDEIKEIMIDTLIGIKDAGGYKGLKEIILEDNNQSLRILSAYALGSIKRRYSEYLLLSALNDGSKEVRAEICHSLGFYSGRKVIQGLLSLIQDDPDRYVRSAALFSIKRIGGKFAILSLFDVYTAEKDPVFKEQTRVVLRYLIQEFS